MKRLGWILVLVGLGCGKVELHHDLKEHQANEILVLLDRFGISAWKESEGRGKDKRWIVLVKQSEATKAWQILRRYELPKELEPGLKETFSQESMLKTSLEEKALFIQAISGEIAKTLKNIDGVINARVHISLPEKSLLKRDLNSKPSASVFLKYIGTKPPYKIREIQNLVAGAISGLDPINISVIGSPRKLIPSPFSKIVSLGPLKMTPESKKILKIIFASILGIILILSFSLILSILKIRNLKSQPLQKNRMVKKEKV
jgi:type III secretion protein J